MGTITPEGTKKLNERIARCEEQPVGRYGRPSCSSHQAFSWDAESIPEFAEPGRWAHEAP
jgi:hypothetical protein